MYFRKRSKEEMITFRVPVVERSFLSSDIVLNDWEQLEPIFKDLLNRNIDQEESFHQWMRDDNEFQCALQEYIRWIMIHSSCDTENKEHQEAQAYFFKELKPKMDPLFQELSEKFLASPFTEKLDEQQFGMMIKRLRNKQSLFREENIDLIAEETVLSRKYHEISGRMTVRWEKEDLSMHEAMLLLQNSDRGYRKEVWTAIQASWRKSREELEDLFDKLISLRHQIALNAGFENFRDYKFADLGRFDYSAEDCFEMHHAIEKQILPLIDQFKKDKLERLGYDTLKPWDSMVDGTDHEPLRPFEDEKDFIKKSIDCLRRTDDYFAKCLETMANMDRLDLVARKGKAPGGYNMSLPESGVPFVFMNANNHIRNVKTMVHEAGHAVHSFLVNSIPFEGQRSLTSEIAELAAMSMELFTLENWKDTFFETEDEMQRAKKYQLKNILEMLPWIATIDAFQHWLYTNPTHSRSERAEAWKKVNLRFSSSVFDWEGTGDFQEMIWLRQLHLFLVPFYYIEYGMAQLGAVAMWRNYLNAPEKTIEEYKTALSLGYTVPIKEIYEAAGIKFDFSESYIKELSDFLGNQLSTISELEPA